MTRIAILVTGSRDWTDREALEGALAEVCRQASPRLSVLIHGDARGADQMAAAYAECDWGIRPLAMPAPWGDYGKRAGVMRNAWMVDLLVNLRACGYECHVIAFPLPTSVGTYDCIRRARGRGFEVREIK